MLLAPWSQVKAQTDDALTLSSTSNTVAENFNSMYDAGTQAGTLTLPAGWRVERNENGPRQVGAFSNGATATQYEGGISLASNAKNGTWNFTSSSDATDRAVGGITTGVANGARGINVMTKLTNADAAGIEKLTISYDVEKYRYGNNGEGFTVQMYYSTNGTDWTSAGDDFKTTFSPDANTAGAEVVPITTVGVTGKQLNTIFGAGSSLYLAWNISVSAGTACASAMALAVDNINISATFADPSVTKHYIYVEDKSKWSNLYCYASGNGEPLGVAPGATATGNTTVNGVEYKYFEIEGEGNYQLTFSDGSTKNVKEPVAATIDGDIYLSVNPNGVDIIADPNTYTGWVDPSRPPFVASGIYIRGELSSWSALSELEFSKEAEGTYALYDIELKGNFKVADANWSSSCNYGSNGNMININEPYTLVAGTDANISCGSNTYYCSKIVLTIIDGTATLLLQSDDDDTGLTSVYVIGDNNEWNYADASGMLSITDEDNVFKGQVTLLPGDNGMSHWMIYQKLGMGGPWGAPGNTDATGNNLSGTLEKGSNGKMSTEAGTYDFTFNLNTGAFSLTRIASEIQSLTIMPQQVVLVPQVPEKVRVLSLNNSLIDYNNQDFMFNDIANGMEKDAVWTKHTNLGKPLSYHWEEGEETTSAGQPSAKALVKSEAWTHIILQEQSSLPRTNFNAFLSNVKTWVEFIRENCPNPNAVVIVPLNWAYSGDWANFTPFNKKFVENYQLVARETGVTICPVGIAYQDVYDKEGADGLTPWFQDDRHPTNLSTYMAACMEYGLIFGEDPTTIATHPTSISDADAEKVRQYASDALKGFTNYVDHTAGVVRLSTVITDQFGMELPAPSDLTLTLNGEGASLSGNVFTSEGVDGEFTVTAETSGMSSTATITVANAVPTTIQSVGKSGGKLTLNGSELTFPGTIEVYANNGQLLSSTTNRMSLSQNLHGVFIVRAKGKQGTETYKMVK